MQTFLDMVINGVLTTAGSATVLVLVFLFVGRTALQNWIEGSIKQGFNHAIEDRKEEFARDIEVHKSSLKNSEAKFSAQFKALTELRRFVRKIPGRPRFPGMDWDEACEDIAASFSTNLDALDEFLGTYEPVLPSSVLLLINEAYSTGIEGSFEFDWDSELDDAVPRPSAKACANQFYEKLVSARDELQKAVNDQFYWKK